MNKNSGILDENISANMIAYTKDNINPRTLREPKISANMHYKAWTMKEFYDQTLRNYKRLNSNKLLDVFVFICVFLFGLFVGLLL